MGVRFWWDRVETRGADLAGSARMSTTRFAAICCQMDIVSVLKTTDSTH